MEEKLEENISKYYKKTSLRKRVGKISSRCILYHGRSLLQLPVSSQADEKLVPAPFFISAFPLNPFKTNTFTISTNTFCASDKYILQLKQIDHFLVSSQADKK